MIRSISVRAISGFVRAARYSAGTPARSNRARFLVELSGRNNRKASMIGTSPRPSVSYTSVWELAVLPSAEAYSVAIPTECVPFLAIAVSSITSTASLPPTSLSAWTSSSVSQALLPRPRRNEVVQSIAFAERKPPRHRLNALAIARADQPRYVERTHLAPRLVPQPIQKRLGPTSKLVSPIQRPANHGRPPQKPTTHESQKN